VEDGGIANLKDEWGDLSMPRLISPGERQSMIRQSVKHQSMMMARKSKVARKSKARKSKL